MRIPQAILAAVLLLAPGPIRAVEGFVLYTRGSDFGGAGDLRLVQLGGGTVDIDNDVRAAVFSPDGSRIVYQRYNGSNWELVRADRDGAGKTVLSDGWGESLSLSWRIPGKIVFAHDRQQQLWELDPDTGEVGVFYTTSAGNDFWSVSVSTDGNRMTFYSRSQARGIWICDLTSGAETHIDGGCGNAISPDGTKFTNNLHTHQDMYIRNWDSSVYKEIGISGEYWNSQRWSRNHDQWIIYSRGPEFYLEGYSNVYVRNIDTDEEVQVTSDGAHDFHRDFWVGTAAVDPALRLNPTTLSFQATEGGADPPSQDVTVTNAGGGTLSDVSVSEDAAWLAVARAGSGNTQTLTNSVDLTGLAPATYSTTVQVSGGGASGAATYDVSLTVNPDVEENQAPSVDAGLDQTIPLGQPADLAGQATDDGLPAGTLEVTWSKVSGPGNVVFFEPGQPVTQATFALDGSYVLRLSADDGLLQASDEVGITVEPGDEPSVTVISPNGGEVWEVGSEQHIRWTAVIVNDVTIRYTLDDGATWEMVSDSVDHHAEDWLDFVWTVPDAPSENVVVRIAEYFDASLNDDSDAPFQICAPGTCPGSGPDPDDDEMVITGVVGCATGGTSSPISVLFLLLVLIVQFFVTSRVDRR